MARKQSQAILFEQVRSFTTMARTLNLSRAVRELGSTRQTVRRHITMLEESMGVELFNIEDRQYFLTEAGKDSLREAESLLARGEAWANNLSGHKNGLPHISLNEEGGIFYHMQQHPLSKLWSDSSILLQDGFQCWAESRGKIESDSLALIRPYMMVFRWLQNSWVCVEVGNKSSYATWFGWTWERSSIGRGVADMPGGPGFGNLLTQPFQDVSDSHSMRLDHIHTRVPREPEGKAIPISYQRLILGCRFPDGTAVLATLIDRTHNIDIHGLSPEMAQSMPKELIMNVNPIDVNLEAKAS